LSDWLAGQPWPALGQRTWGRELLLALHWWIQDYAQDGQRQGFPFDPHLLYFHRRVLRVEAALQDLWQKPGFAAQAPAALDHFRQTLQTYRTDPALIAAAAHYEKVHAIFEEFRGALRLRTDESNPLRAAYPLSAPEEAKVRSDLAQLREHAQHQSLAAADPQQRQGYPIVATHLEAYWPFLAPAPGAERTTDKLEARWGQAKRHCRRLHGRTKLTRDFTALPAELMLVSNLEVPRYVELVLGQWENLPDKLAAAARRAGAYGEWRQKQQTQHWGRVPKRLLRRPNFLDQLLGLADKVKEWFA
jgi:hypothetical protein